ncbi:MAG: flagellar basal body-associated protein FliL [Thiobacillaceae bacterium]|jgi:flagellar FliL protein
MAKPVPAKVDAAAETKGSKKPRKKIIIIAMIVAAAVSAGGASAWFYLGNSGNAKEARHQPPAPPAPVFVNLEPFTVNLQSEDEDHYLQTSIVLQVKDEEAAERIKQHMPQVRSRLLMLLSSKTASEINTAEGKHKLSDEIVAQVKQPFAEGTAEQEVGGVFFTDLVIQ